MFDGRAFGEEVIGIVKDYVGKALVDVKSQIGLLSERLDDLEVREPVPGKDGAPGINGKDGADGLDGKVGVRGMNGENGTNGLDGRDGIDGKSVSLDDVVPVIAREVAFAVARIPAPKDGVGLAGGIIDRSGHLVLTLTDGSPQPVGVVVGKDGAPGKDGAKGLDGKDGQAGERGEDGHPGSDGKNGADGLVGKNGLDGKDAPPIEQHHIDNAMVRYFTANPIRNGQDGKSIKGDEGRGIKSTFIDADGNLVIVYTDGETKITGPVKGADGKDGQAPDQASLMQIIEDRIAEGAKQVTRPQFDFNIPEDMIEDVAKAAAVLAESPGLTNRATSRVTRTIRTRRDENGYLVGDVIERGA